MSNQATTPRHVTRQQFAKRKLVQDRLAAAHEALREATEDLERYRDETKKMYAERWEPQP